MNVEFSFDTNEIGKSASFELSGGDGTVNIIYTIFELTIFTDKKIRKRN